jgi:glutathione peroxidase
MSQSLNDIALNRIDGSATRLGEFRGKVLLIVNVASKCGLTPQYEGLERLYERRARKGWRYSASPATISPARSRGAKQKSRASALLSTTFSSPSSPRSPSKVTASTPFIGH